jgi:hypothetical protein
MSSLARYNLFLAQGAEVLAVLLAPSAVRVAITHAVPEGFGDVPVISPAQGDEGVTVSANDAKSLIACFGYNV